MQAMFSVYSSGFRPAACFLRMNATATIPIMAAMVAVVAGAPIGGSRLDWSSEGDA